MAMGPFILVTTAVLLLAVPEIGGQTVQIGATGATGYGGRTGASGFTGPMGRMGQSGFPGPAGPPGRPAFGGGPMGATGVPGAPGPRGFPGPRGPSGYRGEPGARGAPATDFSNEPGPTGAVGLPGRPGPIGAPGIGGEPGRSGSAGRDGLHGYTGRTGATGRMGERGSEGSRGHTGQMGDPGLPGPPGPSCDPATEDCGQRPRNSPTEQQHGGMMDERWGPWAQHLLNPYLLVVMLVWMFILSMSTLVSACRSRQQPVIIQGSSIPMGHPSAPNGAMAATSYVRYEDTKIKTRPESGYDDDSIKKNVDTNFLVTE